MSEEFYTAEMARKATDAPAVEAKNTVIRNIEPAIKKQAQKGIGWEFFHIGCKTDSQALPELSAVNQEIKNLLEKNGYQVRKTINGNYYVPRGLQDDNGDGPEHVNYGLLIEW